MQPLASLIMVRDEEDVRIKETTEVEQEETEAESP